MLFEHVFNDIFDPLYISPGPVPSWKSFVGPSPEPLGLGPQIPDRASFHNLSHDAHLVLVHRPPGIINSLRRVRCISF